MLGLKGIFGWYSVVYLKDIYIYLGGDLLKKVANNVDQQCVY